MAGICSLPHHWQPRCTPRARPQCGFQPTIGAGAPIIFSNDARRVHKDIPSGCYARRGPGRCRRNFRSEITIIGSNRVNSQNVPGLAFSFDVNPERRSANRRFSARPRRATNVSIPKPSSLPACVTAVEAAGAVSEWRTCWVPAAGADVWAASAGERSACETRRAMPLAAFRRRGSDSDSGGISAKLNRMPPRLRSRPLAGFIEPCLPRPVDRPPIGGTGCTK